jgi:hypothetical protein
LNNSVKGGINKFIVMMSIMTVIQFLLVIWTLLAKGEFLNILTIQTLRDNLLALLIISFQILALIYLNNKPFKVEHLNDLEINQIYWPMYDFAM